MIKPVANSSLIITIFKVELFSLAVGMVSTKAIPRMPKTIEA